jgi:hypothetical protein
VRSEVKDDRLAPLGSGCKRREAVRASFSRGGLRVGRAAELGRKQRKGWVRKRKCFGHFSKEFKQLNSNTDLNSTKQK